MVNRVPYDMLIVGGGINGAGIARDAAGRGLSVLLVEQDDLASHTSSASTKLIHCGLRYLEYGEFRLVRESLIERERLLAIAPHIIWPLEFVLPQKHSPRPAWMVRLGLFLYDHLGGRKVLPATRTIRLDRLEKGCDREFRHVVGTLAHHRRERPVDRLDLDEIEIDAIRDNGSILHRDGMRVVAQRDRPWTRHETPLSDTILYYNRGQRYRVTGIFCDFQVKLSNKMGC